MVELFEEDIKTTGRQSSKGNQLKWESGGIWYKADYTGYEGLAEYVISHLLERSSLSREEFVVYDLEQIRYRSRVFNGARSTDFLEQGWQLITLERLFQLYYGQSLQEAVWRIADCDARFRFLVQTVEEITGLSDFAGYLDKLFTIDAFFLNEDRHMHNIAVLMDGKGAFRTCPVFDNGAGLLADTTMDYPMGEDVFRLLKTVRARTISRDFNEQLETADAAAGSRLQFYFRAEHAAELLEKAVIYPQEVRDRVETIIRDRMRKYRNLFPRVSITPRLKAGACGDASPD